MTINKKKIGLGVLSAVTAIAIPITTVISCGKTEKELPDGPVTGGFSEGMPFTWNIMNASSGIINAITEKDEKADVLAKKHEWKTIYTESTVIKAESERTEEETQNLEETAKRINKEIIKKIKGLNDIQKRSLVISVSDKDVEFKDAKQEYKITVYSTMNSKEDMSPELRQFINSFLKNSNSKAKSFDAYNNLDKITEKDNMPLQDYATKRYLSAQRSIRNVNDDKDGTYKGEAFVDNGLMTAQQYEQFIQEIQDKKIFKFKENDLNSSKNLDVAASPAFDVNNGQLKQKITFYEGIKLKSAEDTKKDGDLKGNFLTAPQWKLGAYGGRTPIFEGYKNVFTINPVVQELDNSEKYNSKGFEKISDDDLVNYIGMAHAVMFHLKSSLGMKEALKILREVLPVATPFILTNGNWINSLDNILRKKTPNDAVKTIEDLVRKNIGTIRESIKTKPTLSENRLEYSFYRDHNNQTKSEFSKTFSSTWEVKKELPLKNKEIIDLFQLSSLASANVTVITMLFDYLNILYVVGDKLDELYNQ